MKHFSIKELAQIINAEPTESTACFTGLSTDSRTIKPGQCFFAIEGENFDGHDYIQAAFDKGAACAVVDKNVESSGGPLLQVDDCITALQDFAARYRQIGNFKVIAITGSVGKTTTRRIAYHVLSQFFPTFQAPKNFNNDIGLPLTLLGADLDHKIIVAEIGSNSPGEIARLTRIARPDIAVVTNVHPAHLAGFGNLQTIMHEKLSIAEGLKPTGALIINGCIDSLVETCKTRYPLFTTFGRADHCDIHAENMTFTGSVSHFTIDAAQVLLPLPGPGNIENALAAWAICRRFELTTNDFAQALRTLPPVAMRAEFLQIGTLTVLNDCYNANPASMQNALDILAQLGSSEKRRLVFICGDMAELGPQSTQLHGELGKSIARAGVKVLLAVGQFAQITTKAAKTNADGDFQAQCFETTDSACNNLAGFIKDYDIVLVKGSRTARLERIADKLKELQKQPAVEIHGPRAKDRIDAETAANRRRRV